eukprot:CAMPEP_0168752690 /NCGR_PEP_ID=MMETSP0724-20121128/18530_1 /TAXON_ID=265536 /ORGANISM="Amphiprora sp., Strain CCMP467" /LENGTH=476 /DNA_ID=CAMNT_0008800975 /DNA_START=21 /DNA_END=1448 /DNA_ORIENTATION=+
MSESGSPKSPTSPSGSGRQQQHHFRQGSSCSLEDIDLLPDSEEPRKPDSPRALVWIGRKIELHYQSTIAKVPPKYRWLFLFVWVAWKFVAVYLVYYVFQTKEPAPMSKSIWVPSILPNGPSPTNGHSSKVRVLYIFASTASQVIENDNTNHRLTVLPLLRQNVISMLDEGFHVDLVWIYQDERSESQDEANNFHQRVRDAVPADVGLSFWPQASPIVWNSESRQLQDSSTKGTQQEQRQQLLNQAWWIVRDKLSLYHLFLVWPDGANVRGSHVAHFWESSQRLLSLSMSEQGGDTSWLIPAFVPAFPSPRRGLSNTTTSASSDFEKVLRSLQSSNGQPAWDHFETGMSLDAFESGQLVPTNSFHTNETIEDEEQVNTITVPASSLSIQTGFMVTRSQLAHHGMLECLFPNNTLPIARPNLDQSKKTNNLTLTLLPSNRSCHPIAPGILFVPDLSRHVVPFAYGFNEQQQFRPVSDW